MIEPSEAIHLLEAATNLAALQANKYPGRGLIMGLSNSGKHLVEVYWLSGRRFSSRNRLFLKDGNRLYTDKADLTVQGDGNDNLIYYNAMDSRSGHYVVSNGRQTDDVIEAGPCVTLNEALAHREYEPDPDIYTPRITASAVVENYLIKKAEFSVLRKAPDSMECIRDLYTYPDHAFKAGTGFCLTTYKADGNPPETWTGVPILMPLHGTIKDILDTYWGALSMACIENLVSVAVKTTTLGTLESELIHRNRYNRIG